MATQPQTGSTYADLEKFPDPYLRREIIDGEFVEEPQASPHHEAVLRRHRLEYYGEREGTPRVSARGYTWGDLLAFPGDKGRAEVIDGELLVYRAGSAAHQSACGRVLLALHDGLKDGLQDAGWKLWPPLTGIRLADDSVVQPDATVVSADNPGRLEERCFVGAPNIVVEVSSPSTRRLDLDRKRELYLRFEVPEYWYIDVEVEQIRVFRLGEGYREARTLGRGDTLESPEVPGLAIAADYLLGPAESEPRG